MYANGYVPLSTLVRLTGSGGLNHWLPPATAARWYELQRRALKRTGKVLHIWSGWDAYRPYAEQVRMKAQACAAGNCLGAATPGQSSHGGTYNGREAFAFDAGDWGYVYNWDRAAFFEDCRAVGLSPGEITPTQSGQAGGEPWHVIDYNSRSAVPAYGTVSPFPAETNNEEEDDDMRVLICEGDGAGARPPRLVGPGWVRGLNSQEEVEQAALLGSVKRINARQYDLAMSMVTTGYFEPDGVGILVKGQSDDRPWTILGPGYVRRINSQEEFEQSGPLFSQTFVGNDRQYDLWVSLALSGQGAVSGELNYDLLVKKLVEKLPQGGRDIDPEEFAKAVRAEFAENPLR